MKYPALTRAALVVLVCCRFPVDSQASDAPEFIELEGLADGVTVLEADASGTRLLTFSEQTGALLWNFVDGELVAELSDPPQTVDSVEFNHRCDAILGRFTSPEGQSGIIIWQSGDGSKIGSLSGGGGGAAIAVGPGGELCAIEGRPGFVRIYDFSFTHPVRVLAAHDAEIHRLALSPDGGTLAAATAAGEIKIWDAAADEPVATFVHGEGLREVGFSPDGSRLISRIGADTEEGELKLWNTVGGGALATVDGVLSWSFGQDEGAMRMVVLLEGGSASVIDIEDGASLAAIDEPEQLWRVALSRDGSRLATASINGQVKLWDASSGELLQELGQAPGLASNLIFGHDGGLIAVGDTQGMVLMLPIADGSGRLEFKAHELGVGRMVLNATGTRLASSSAGEDGDVRIWILGEEEEDDLDALDEPDQPAES